MSNQNETYYIIRFDETCSSVITRKGLTLEEAQAHCQDPRTAGAGWFDGYEKEED